MSTEKNIGGLELSGKHLEVALFFRCDFPFHILLNSGIHLPGARDVCTPCFSELRGLWLRFPGETFHKVDNCKNRNTLTIDE